MKKVYVFGSFIMDHITNCDNLPREGETVFGENFEVSYGGKGINQAMMIKKLGGDVEMIGALGKDNNGDMFTKLLKEYNFPLENIFYKDTPTGISNIILNSEGQNRIIVVPGANSYLTSEDILSLESNFLEDSIFLIQNEIPVSTIETIVNIGVKKHATIVLNPAPYVKHDISLINKINYITPNETEATLLFGLKEYDEEEILKRFKKLQTKYLIMTLGEKGSLFTDKNLVLKNEPFKVNVVDTVGAGDAFNGGFVFGLANNYNLETCLRLANGCGAFTIQKKGAMVSQPTLKELMEFLNCNK